MLKHLAKLRADAAEAALVSNQATEPAKRELFDKIAQHLTVLADEVQREIDKRSSVQTP